MEAGVKDKVLNVQICGRQQNRLSKKYDGKYVLQRSGNFLKTFFSDDRGVGVVEIILILVVLISLVILFKSQLTSLVTDILNKITSQSSGI